MTSSEERRKVAERIRTYGSGFDFGDSNPFWYVCKAVFGDVKTRTYYDVFNRLADLIDPVGDETTFALDRDAEEVYPTRWWKCAKCGELTIMMCDEGEPVACPYCGRRVVSSNGLD